MRSMFDGMDKADRTIPTADEIAAVKAHAETLLAHDLGGGFKSTVDTVHDQDINWEFRTIEIRGKIVAPDGQMAGDWTRQLRPAGTYYDGDGTAPAVHHSEIVLQKEYAGKGVGSRFVAESEKAYKEAGYEKVTLAAGYESGGYVWAKAGYGWSEGMKGEKEAHYLRYKAGTLGLGGADEKKLGQMISSDKFSPKDLADFHTKDGRHVGKELMAGSYWVGEKTL